MTRPGLSGVWKNVMVMYKNMVGFSNVTGDMVLTEHSMARSYKGPLEGDTNKKYCKIQYGKFLEFQFPR